MSTANYVMAVKVPYDYRKRSEKKMNALDERQVSRTNTPQERHASRQSPRKHREISNN
jgi:hypothetical protein